MQWCLYWARIATNHRWITHRCLLQRPGWCTPRHCCQWLLGWQIRKNLLRCSSFQSTRPLQLTIQPLFLLPPARIFEEACIWTESQRSATHLFYPMPLVLSPTGGMANEATVFYKRLASCLAMKWDQSYSSMMFWLHCHLTFSLLRSAIQCIRGARSSNGHAAKSPPPIKLAISELRCIWTILLLDPWLIWCSQHSFFPLYTISSLTPYMSVHVWCTLHTWRLYIFYN